MDSIPIELILEYCSTVDILKLSNTCKRFETICKKDSTWYYLLKKDHNIKYNKSDPLKKYTQNILNDLSKILTNFGYYYREIYDQLRQKYTKDISTIIAKDEDKYNIQLGFTPANILWHSARYYELALACLNVDVQQGTINIHSNIVSKQILSLLKAYHRYPNTLLALLIYKEEMEEYLARILNYYNDLKQRPSEF